MKKRSDIPFSKDASRFFLPWMSMLMVFIGTLILSAALAVYTSIGSWHEALSGSMTVQIPAYDEKGTFRSEALKTDIETALTILRSSEGIKGASVLSDEQMQTLMNPWISEQTDIAELPLPKLIDVTIDTTKTLDLVQITADLKDQVPSAVLDSHRLWLKSLINIGRGIIRLMIFVMILLTLTVSFTVIYTTRTSLSVHKPVIALVHMMGANDYYVALQYAWRSLKLTLFGGVIGLLLALPLMYFVSGFIKDTAYDFIISFDLTPWQWRSIVLVPIIVSVLAFLTTYKTVTGYLKRFL